MKSHGKALPVKKRDDTKSILIIGIVILLLQFIFHFSVVAQSTSPDSLKNELNRQLNNPSLIKGLNFPNSVRRFYGTNFTPNWLRSEENIRPTVSAMLLLDCITQYGLQRKDYHPEILNYSLMYDILHTETVPVVQKVEFELMLTDAMISMINHLHYGAYNPYFSRSAIDSGVPNQLNAVVFLHGATASPNLMETVLTVQPKIDQYKLLQGYMKLILGQYTCDSYETPEEEIKTIAINMERLRWRQISNDSYLHVNIPSFKLTYYAQNKASEFRIVVGKPTTPTPTLASEITYLETGPDWNIPNKIFINELLPKATKDNRFFDKNHIAIYDKQENYVVISAKTITQIRANPKYFHARQSSGCDNALGKVVFRFKNAYNIYLHDTPEKQYFTRKKRALSHGCIRVENADKLAGLLLKSDEQTDKVSAFEKAVSSYHKNKFTLKTPLPILISYLTTTVEDGLLVRHEDLYQHDKVLMARMFKKAL